LNASTELARQVISMLFRHGVREIVLAPGSRNAPLAFAAYDAAEAGLVRLHTRIDERTAGFLALGLAKASRAPAAVICTSGTAVANLHPAVLEAVHAAVELVAVTADRPVRLRGTSANQTTDQVGVFGPLVPTMDFSAEDAPSWVMWRGPLHLNVAFDEPLVPSDRWAGEGPDDADPDDENPDHALPRSALAVAEIAAGPRTVVVAGDDAGPPARVVAQEMGWPLLAEPTSGCRTGANVIRCYRLLLDGELGSRIERVVVFGHPTLSRPVTRLLAREGVDIWATPGVWGRRPFRVDHEVGGTQALDAPRPDDVRGGSEVDRRWLAEWGAADAEVSRRLDALLAGEAELTPHAAAATVSRSVPPGGMLFVGASSPIRDLDLMATIYPVGERRKILANRGLSGIDGTLSSAIGAALARPDGHRNLALVGDVTFLHDSNALILGPDEPRPDLTIVVVNDDGGSIFATLEQGDPAYADRYERLFGTPHRVDLGSLCAATRTPHWRVESVAELTHALTQPAGGIEVIEVRVRRDNRRALDEQIRALVER
jgi:2-succinyl-5-enolpyruvyl-6-hydroxy-3-cyclohexene-1-carboxylate synthase